jgi:hypothetical protein
VDVAAVSIHPQHSYASLCPLRAPLPFLGDLVAKRIRDGDITLFSRVCVDSGGRVELCPILAIRSARLAPDWEARVFPVWRRS